MGKKTRAFFRNIINSKSTDSSKRLITLIISLHFILASFSILFISFYVIFYIPKGQVDEKLLNLLKEVLEYDFYIILSGLGFITAEGAVTLMVEKAKAKAQMMYGNMMYGNNTFMGGGYYPPYQGDGTVPSEYQTPKPPPPMPPE